MNRIATIALLAVCGLALVVWDVYVTVIEPEATISAMTLAWAQRHPIVPFVIGVLGGHLCWPQRTECDRPGGCHHG